MTALQQISEELESLVARIIPAVVSVEQKRGQGSGVVLAQDGYILTNAHVVGRARSVKIGTSDGEYRDGEVMGIDRATDLAVLRVDASGLLNLPLAENRRVKVGQLVVAIGNPLRFERSVSLGIVSALDRRLPQQGGRMFEGLIQTDAAINPGNSGGPLVDGTGTVVGINTAIIPYAQGIGFAIPAYTATWVAAVLIREGEVSRPMIGIAANAIDLPPVLAEMLDQSRAVRVHQVVAATPAYQAGIRSGDLLLSVNGTPLASIDDLQRVMVLSGAEEYQLTVLRGEQKESMSIRPAPPAAKAG